MHANAPVDLVALISSYDIKSDLIYLHQLLQIVGDLVPHIQRSVLAWLIRNLEQVKDLGLIDIDFAGKFGQTLVRVVSCFIYHVHIKIFFLGFEESG